MPPEEQTILTTTTSVTVSIVHPSPPPTAGPSTVVGGPASYQWTTSQPLEDGNAAAPAQATQEMLPAALDPQANRPRGRQSPIYDVPGSDYFPSMPGTRGDSRWMAGPFDIIVVGGRSFTIPARLLQRDAFWRMMRSIERPPQGWHMPDEDPNIFAVLLESVYSPSGFSGNERHLNMVLLALALVMAKRWDMPNEVHKLESSIRRYIVRRVLFRHPFLPDTERLLNHNYFVFRSEEIYRTWELCQRYAALDLIISTSELISLYATAIPNELWPALTSTFNQDFTQLIDITAAVRQVPAEHSFEDWWFKFFKMAGYLDYTWFDPHVLDRYFVRRDDDDDDVVPPNHQAEFEAARARGDAIIAAYNANGQAAAQAVAAAPNEVLHAAIEAIDGLGGSSNDTTPTATPANEPVDSAHGVSDDDANIAQPVENLGQAATDAPHGVITPERSPRVHFADQPESFDAPAEADAPEGEAALAA